MRRRRILDPCLLTVAYLVACLGCSRPSTPSPARALSNELPDVLLLTLDTFRADRLGIMGHPRGLTPALDAVLRQSVLCSDAQTPVPLTAPAHATLFSGVDPQDHGVRENALFHLSPEVLTIPSALQKAGWKTSGFVSSLPLHRRFGFATGFDHFDDSLESRRAGDLSYPERSAQVVVDSVLAFAARSDEARHYYWAHFFDAHHPRTVLPSLKALPGADDYDREIRGLDVQIRRLVRDFTWQRGEPIIAVATDHGEGLGDHGEISHGVLLYPPTMHGLLGIRSVANRHSDELATPARLVNRVVPYRDFAPTLFEALAIAIPEEFSGESFWTSSSDSDGLAYGETYYCMFHYGWSPLLSLRSEKWTYIDAPEPELYDRRSDPGERHNVIDSHGEVAKEYARLLAPRKREPRPAENESVDAETEEDLASLGYVAGGSVPRVDRKKNPKVYVRVANLLFRGMTLQSEGKLPEALPVLQRAFREDPENYAIVFQLADCMRQLGDVATAMSYYQRAISLHPGAAEAYSHLALLTFDSGNRERAFQLLEEGRRVSPTNFSLLMTTGDLLLDVADPSKALSLYEKASEVEPDRPEPWIGLGEAHHALGNGKKSTEMMSRARKIDPTHPRLQEFDKSAATP